ncbi:MAG: hypothetical protein M3Z64_11120 [Verrucomicrobiota bacterium]|nr:hypothetical protein [Verrucomicrobiota bacterium]
MPTPTVEGRTSNAEGRSRIGDVAWRLVGIAVGAVFVYAGVLKAMDPPGFANDIENFHIVPWVIGVRMAFYLPWLEIVAGLALISRRCGRGALAILTALMLAFVGATIIAKMRGIDVSCGCFGHAARNLSFASHLAIDLAILAALLALIWRSRSDSSPATLS